MTLIPAQAGQAERQTFAEGLMQAFEAVLSLTDMGRDLGEHTTVRTEHIVRVRSEAEVDGAAAQMQVTASRTSADSYRAVKRTGAVTIIVAHYADPAGLADAATIAGICGWAGSEVPAVTA